MQGEGVDIYIIDRYRQYFIATFKVTFWFSGIAVDNPQFKGKGVHRAIWVSAISQ